MRQYHQRERFDGWPENGVLAQFEYREGGVKWEQITWLNRYAEPASDGEGLAAHWRQMTRRACRWVAWTQDGQWHKWLAYRWIVGTWTWPHADWSCCQCSVYSRRNCIRHEPPRNHPFLPWRLTHNRSVPVPTHA